ncbi:hypothetical protein HG537_0F03790 [Torulaspora globosa]|uniref:Nuclear transport factor 2 n=1 Tax=Torulaspora globosa TaxID=48254 RepID=A0A7H9HV59_9SACH|nr:hypothetical protein HG537_0F03790 [Torulaspora sp. CBS 2947]
MKVAQIFQLDRVPSFVQLAFIVLRLATHIYHLMSLDFNALAQQFTEFYYNQFDTDRSQLGNLYRDESMLTFETSQLQGAKDIVEKLVSLPFQRVQHRITTLDAQPASPSGDVLVMITGDLLIDEEQNPQRFSQVFHLIPDGSSYYVFNDIFRLNYSA